MESEPAAAAAVFGDRLPLARAYAQWLCDAGVQRGLLGPREADRIWSRHLLNCAVVAPLLPPSARVVDVGSGAGLPGIPLLLARPDVVIALVEPLERRCTFLGEVIADLQLQQCTVVRGRAEDVADQVGGADVVTSRAVAPLGKLAAWCVPLGRVGGEILALKGASAADELHRDRQQLHACGLTSLRLEVIGADALPEPTRVVRGVITGERGRRRPAGRRR